MTAEGAAGRSSELCGEAVPANVANATKINQNRSRPNHLIVVIIASSRGRALGEPGKKFSQFFRNRNRKIKALAPVGMGKLKVGRMQKIAIEGNRRA